MKKICLLFCALPVFGTAQVFTKIDASVTGFTQGVNSPSQTIKTQDGHIWFNSLVASRYRLYEYDGSTYNYHGQFFDSTVSAMRDISATIYAQAKDGTIYTQGGQYYKNGIWRKTPFQQVYLAKSQDGNTLYFNKNSDSLFSLTNGVFTGYNVALNQIPGIAAPFGSAIFKDAVADNQGNLYFATQDTGVVKVHAASGTVSYMPIYVGSQFVADARTLHVASNGHLYVGSGGSYLAYHDGIQWTVLTNMQPWDFGMDRIDDIAEDSQGRVWIGSRTSSIAGFIGRFDETDPTQLFDVIWDTTSNHQYISDRNTEAILIDNDSTFYFGVYQENYLLKARVSNTISLMETPTASELEAYPNPVINSLHMDMEFSSTTTLSVSIMDMNGSLISKKEVEVHSGFNSLQLSMDSFSPGIYMVVITDTKSADFRTFKVIKK